jgi:hypothetical protein
MLAHQCFKALGQLLDESQGIGGLQGQVQHRTDTMSGAQQASASPWQPPGGMPKQSRWSTGAVRAQPASASPWQLPGSMPNKSSSSSSGGGGEAGRAHLCCRLHLCARSALACHGDVVVDGGGEERGLLGHQPHLQAERDGSCPRGFGAASDAGTNTHTPRPHPAPAPTPPPRTHTSLAPITPAALAWLRSHLRSRVRRSWPSSSTRPEEGS